MRPHAHEADHQRAKSYELIANRYLRYVLIRGTAYTNEQTLLQRIAAYTLITTCLLSDRLRRSSDLGLVVDTILDMVGQDQIECPKLQIADCGLRIEEEDDPSDQLNTPEVYRLRPEACDADDGPAVFLLSAPLCEVAGAVNGLERFERELLILHHLEGLDTPALAEISRVSPKRIERTLAKAERGFVALLRATSSWNHEIEPDVHGLLADFAACLDQLSPENLGTFVLSWLAEHGG
jgi:DNA-directed RNA polymerase specialized sigma24 family protein